MTTITKEEREEWRRSKTKRKSPSTPAYNLIDITGKRFGKLTVLMREKNNMRGKSRWLCRCDCGETSIVEGVNLRNGHSKSCSSSCSQRQHGYGGRKNRKSEYMIWSQMKDRCTNKNNKNFHHYGGRGIIVCKEWMDSFEQFLKDMGSRPSDMHSIDRIDVDGNYDPNNCRWATHKEQMNNTRWHKTKRIVAGDANNGH